MKLIPQKEKVASTGIRTMPLSITLCQMLENSYSKLDFTVHHCPFFVGFEVLRVVVMKMVLLNFFLYVTVLSSHFLAIKEAPIEETSFHFPISGLLQFPSWSLDNGRVRSLWEPTDYNSCTAIHHQWYRVDRWTREIALYPERIRVKPGKCKSWGWNVGKERAWRP
jgi:hypothetical protein